MATGGIAVVHADGVQVIRLFLHFWDAKGSLDLAFEVADVLFHLSDLLLQLLVVLTHELNGFSCFGLVASGDLILERLMVLHFLTAGRNDILVYLVRLILLFEEVPYKRKHRPDVIV